MLFYKNIKLLQPLIRYYANNVKPKVKLDDEVSSGIDNLVFKPKNHPGRIKPRNVALPENALKAIQCVVQDHPIKSLVKDGEILWKYLHNRLPPTEKDEFNKIRKEILQEVLSETPEVVNITNENDAEQFKQSVADKVRHRLKHKIYNWKPVDYNVYNSLAYLFGRFAPEYATLVRIFSEINLRDAKFKPRSLFDFGSGTGTVTWAADLYWKGNIFEYFNVDSSGDMNDLAQLLLQGGQGTKQGTLKGHFYRQFLPANNISYDLVVSAFSLLELPSLKARLQTILNLWNKTGQYLVIVEQGSNAGFKIVNEARDLILNIQDEVNVGHVFSPCPHDLICPKYVVDVPCKFAVLHYSLPFSGPSTVKTEHYSYVILKRGIRNSDDPRWPRLVEHPMVRSRHTICRMCSGSGKLEEVIFSAAKQGKSSYYCARSSEWGDLLPIEIQTEGDNK